MTQGKKKKRAANRSIMLAKKIIIKDGGTVSRGAAPGSVPRAPPPGPFLSSAWQQPPLSASCPIAVPWLRGLSFPALACGLRGPSSRRSRSPLEHLPSDPGGLDASSLACALLRGASTPALPPAGPPRRSGGAGAAARPPPRRRPPPHRGPGAAPAPRAPRCARSTPLALGERSRSQLLPGR